LKGGDSRYRVATFHPSNFDIPSIVDVAIMQRPALVARVLSIAQGLSMPPPSPQPPQCRVATNREPAAALAYSNRPAAWANMV
jgi:hypothetical protein